MTIAIAPPGGVCANSTKSIDGARVGAEVFEVGARLGVNVVGILVVGDKVGIPVARVVGLRVG